MISLILRRVILAGCLFIGLWWIIDQVERARREAPLVMTGNIERIVIDKSDRTMAIYQNEIRLKTYRIALGFAPAGDKLRQGDGKTPEGVYKIDRRNDASQFHLSLGIDYPQPQDRARAAKGGYSPGGDIFIHGQPNGLDETLRVKGDWTNGCVALLNSQMREIWDHTPIGTLVEIRP